MAKRLFKDIVCLWLNTTSLEQAIAIARDMRSCTHTVLVSPTFFLANGPSGIRCFHELGIHEVLLDMRLLGSPKEVWQCVIEAAKQGVKAVSVHSLAGSKNLKYAIQAAEASMAQTQKINRPRVLLSLLPADLEDAELVDELGLRVKRGGHVTLSAKQSVQGGADGLIVEYEDIGYVRRVSKKIPLLVYAQRKPRNFAEVERAEDLGHASIKDIMHAGADHIILDSTLIAQSDIEWSADLVNKELAQYKEESGSGKLRLNLSCASLLDIKR